MNPRRRRQQKVAKQKRIEAGSAVQAEVVVQAVPDEKPKELEVEKVEEVKEPPKSKVSDAKKSLWSDKKGK